MEVISSEDWEILMELVKKDIVGTGYNPDNYTVEQLHSFTSEFAVIMREAVRKCGLPLAELAAITEEHGQVIDKAGISEREKGGSRWDLVQELAENRPEDDQRSCKEYAEGRRKWLILEFGKDE